VQEKWAWGERFPIIKIISVQVSGVTRRKSKEESFKLEL
jgi:hypothetical protein